MKRKPSLSLLIAVAALVFAMAGTGIAASHYLITSTDQIKPSVLRTLRSDDTALDAASGPAKRGVKGVRLQAHLASGSRTEHRKRVPPLHAKTGATPTAQEMRSLQLTESSWTQYPEEVNELVGAVTLTLPTVAECGGEARGYVEVLVDGESIGWAPMTSKTGTSPVTESTLFEWESKSGVIGTDWWLFPESGPTTHTLEVQSYEEKPCKQAAFVVNGFTLDVLGVR